MAQFAPSAFSLFSPSPQWLIDALGGGAPNGYSTSPRVGVGGSSRPPQGRLQNGACCVGGSSSSSSAACVAKLKGWRSWAPAQSEPGAERVSWSPCTASGSAALPSQAGLSCAACPAAAARDRRFFLHSSWPRARIPVGVGFRARRQCSRRRGTWLCKEAAEWAALPAQEDSPLPGSQLVSWGTLQARSASPICKGEEGGFPSSPLPGWWGEGEGREKANQAGRRRVSCPRPTQRVHGEGEAEKLPAAKANGLPLLDSRRLSTELESFVL